MVRLNMRFNYVAMAMIATVLLLMACTAPQDNHTNPATQAQFSTTSIATVTDALSATATDALGATATYYIVPTALDNMNDPNPPPTDFPGDIGTTEPGEDLPNVTPSPLLASAPVRPEDKISPDLAKAMKDNSNDIRFIAVLSEQATFNDDTSSMSNTQKNDYVYNKRKEVANRTQPAVEQAIISLKQEGKVKEYSAMMIPNAFYVIGTADAVSALAARTDISFLQLSYQGQPESLGPSPQPASITDRKSNNPLSVEWNINLIDAPALWTLPTPVNGTNVTVGIIDSGAYY